MEQQFKIAALMGDIEKAPPEAQLEACHHLLKYNFILKNTVNRLLGSHAPDTTGADLFKNVLRAEGPTEEWTSHMVSTPGLIGKKSSTKKFSMSKTNPQHYRQGSIEPGTSLSLKTSTSLRET